MVLINQTSLYQQNKTINYLKIIYVNITPFSYNRIIISKDIIIKYSAYFILY